MFEAAELGRRISKKEYEEQVPLLRQRLLEVQGELRSANFPVLVLFGGVDGAGKGELTNLLSEWMDPRLLVTRAFAEPSDEEAERPEYWRYWRDLPPKGHIGLFLSAWYSRPLLHRVYGKITESQLNEQLERINGFEKTLVDDGTRIVKYWMHLARAAQKKRLRGLERDDRLKWRVTKRDWKHWRSYEDFVGAAERIIMRTSNGHAPWKIVEGMDPRYRNLNVGVHLLEEMNRALEDARRRTTVVGVSESSPQAETIDEDRDSSVTILSKLDMTSSLNKGDYRRRLEELQGRLNLLHRRARDSNTSVLLVFEGWDAAGKGGAIRRITAALDARHYQVISIAAPTDEERAHHYLWRFWRHLSRAGRFTIFDRSWYGRVLVERVEGFAADHEWRRAYAEINDFERQLVDHGIVILKFWLHITKDEQKARFDSREQTPYKRWKLTDEDWRNRDRWKQYELAVHDMVERTSTRAVPWRLVEGNDKRFARVKVLEAVCDRLAALESVGDVAKPS